MNIESSSKVWAVLFSSIILGIVGYFGYKFYFPKEEVIVLDKMIEPSPTPAPFRWDLYLDVEDATAEAKESTSSAQIKTEVTKGGVENTKTTTTTSSPKTTKTTITTSTSTNNNGEKTSETRTYTTSENSYVIEVRAEAHASAEVK